MAYSAILNPFQGKLQLVDGGVLVESDPLSLHLVNESNDVTGGTFDLTTTGIATVGELDVTAPNTSLTIKEVNYAGIAKFPVISPTDSLGRSYAIQEGGLYLLAKDTYIPQVYLAGDDFANATVISTDPTSATLLGTMVFNARNQGDTSYFSYPVYIFNGNGLTYGWIDFTGETLTNAPINMKQNYFYDSLDTYANSYGILIGDIDKTVTGATTAYSIKTGLGRISFGDSVQVAGNFVKYNNIATVSNGIPSELATVDLTAQSAAKSATTIYTPTASGMFRISIALQVTTAATTSSVLGGATGVTITYTEPNGSVAQSIKPLLTDQAGAVVVPATGNIGNATTTQSQGSAIIYAKTGVAIQYAIGYTSVGLTTMKFAAHLKVEAL